MMNCRRGDVLLVLFPNSDLRTAKKRPVLVIQADDLHTGLPQVVVAMITSNMARAPHPSRVVVEAARERAHSSGLLTDSVIMADNLATILDSEIDRTIGSIGMEAVDAALRTTLALG